MKEKPESQELIGPRLGLRERFRRAVEQARQVLRERGLSEAEIDAELNLTKRKPDV